MTRKNNAKVTRDVLRQVSPSIVLLLLVLYLLLLVTVVPVGMDTEDHQEKAEP